MGQHVDIIAVYRRHQYYRAFPGLRAIKQLILLELTEQPDKQFHLSTTLNFIKINVYFVISNLQRSLNSL